MSPFQKLIILALRNLDAEPNPPLRADLLEAAATALAESDPPDGSDVRLIAERAALTATLIRSAEEAQGRFKDLLPPT
jgi:hypothetical protein